MHGLDTFCVMFDSGLTDMVIDLMIDERAMIGIGESLYDGVMPCTGLYCITDAMLGLLKRQAK